MAGRSRSFGRDRGLQSRMLLTMFLLGLVYAVLIGALVAAGTGADDRLRAPRGDLAGRARHHHRPR